MKKQYQAAEFAAVFLFYILPPVLRGPAAAQAAGAQQWRFPYIIILWFFTAVILYLQINHCKTADTIPVKKNYMKYIIYSGTVLVTFGSLCVTAAVFEFTAWLTGMQSPHPALPFTVPEYAMCIAAFGLSAFYEETVYRLYLPYALKNLFFLKGKVAFTVYEVLPVTLFALGHRYLGVPAVMNALIAGIILRRCTVKSGTVVTGFIAHFAYNILMLILQ